MSEEVDLQKSPTSCDGINWRRCRCKNDWEHRVTNSLIQLSRIIIVEDGKENLFFTPETKKGFSTLQMDN